MESKQSSIKILEEKKCRFDVAFNLLGMPIFPCAIHKGRIKYTRMRTQCFQELAKIIYAKLFSNQSLIRECEKCETFIYCMSGKKNRSYTNWQEGARQTGVSKKYLGEIAGYCKKHKSINI